MVILVFQRGVTWRRPFSKLAAEAISPVGKSPTIPKEQRPSEGNRGRTREDRIPWKAQGGRKERGFCFPYLDYGSGGFFRRERVA